MQILDYWRPRVDASLAAIYSYAEWGRIEASRQDSSARIGGRVGSFSGFGAPGIVDTSPPFDASGGSVLGDLRVLYSAPTALDLGTALTPSSGTVELGIPPKFTAQSRVRGMLLLHLPSCLFLLAS